MLLLAELRDVCNDVAHTGVPPNADPNTTDTLATLNARVLEPTTIFGVPPTNAPASL